LRAFVDRRGVDLFALEFDHWDRFISYDEDVLGTEPFEARFTFTIDEDTITLTVDESLEVADIKRTIPRNDRRFDCLRPRVLHPSHRLRVALGAINSPRASDPVD
jgi:hypothetical protein